MEHSRTPAPRSRVLVHRLAGDTTTARRRLPHSALGAEAAAVIQRLLAAMSAGGTSSTYSVFVSG